MTMLPHYLRILFSLLAIGIFLYIIYYVLTILPSNKNLRNKSKRMQFVEQLFVGPGVVVYIIKVDDQEFLMGLSNKTINFIQPLNVTADFSKVLNEKTIERKTKRTTSPKVIKKDVKDGSN